MKDLYSQVRQIELDQREKLIGQIARKLKGKTKPSFSTVMHKLAEKDHEPSNLIQNIDFAVDNYESSDLSAENLAEMWG